MKPALIPMFVACLALTACNGSSGGGLRIEPLPAAAQQPCPVPQDFLGARDWEIIAGRIGDALIECEGRRALAARAYEGVRRAAGGR